MHAWTTAEFQERILRQLPDPTDYRVANRLLIPGEHDSVQVLTTNAGTWGRDPHGRRAGWRIEFIGKNSDGFLPGCTFLVRHTNGVLESFGICRLSDIAQLIACVKDGHHTLNM